MKSILEEAEEVTNGSRNKAYGHALPNHRDIGYGWTGILRAKGLLKDGCEVAPETAALMMVWLKVARECHAHRRDNLVDLAGYAKCVDEIHQAYELDDSDPGDEAVPLILASTYVDGSGAMIPYNKGSGMITTSGWPPVKDWRVDVRTMEGDIACP